MFRNHQSIIFFLVAAFLTGSIDSPVRAGDPATDCDDRLILISKDPNGPVPDGHAQDVVMTPDARYVVFTSGATNLVPGDLNGHVDVFVLDRDTDQIENVHVSSAGDQANSYAYDTGLAVTPDGRYVVFGSTASNLIPGIVGDLVVLRDRNTDQTELISVSAVGTPVPFSLSPAISDDGRYVAFWGLGSNGIAQVFLRDRQLGTTTVISRSSPTGPVGDAHSGPNSTLQFALFVTTHQIVMSSDGRFVAFASLASNLVAGDLPNTRDVFVYDQQTTQLELISVGFDGSAANGSSMGEWDSWTGPDNLAMTPDGRYVAFDSRASNLVESDPNGDGIDMFVRDRQTQTTSRLDIPTSDLLGHPLLTNDARYVFFAQEGFAPMVPGHKGGICRFRYDRQTDTIAAIYATSLDYPANNWTMSSPGSVSADGLTTVFAWQTEGVPEFGASPQAFLRQLADETDEDCNLNLIPDACEPPYLDVALFVSHLLHDVPPPDAAIACLLDRNNDGELNGLDIGPFLEDLLSGG